MASGLFFASRDVDLRVQVLLVLDDDGAHDARGFVDLALHGDARDHVAEFDLAGLLGEDRDVVRVPFREVLALLTFSPSPTWMTEPMTMV